MLQVNQQNSLAPLDKTQTLVSALKNADLYDHPVSSFSIIETHISWIILTGHYAYKIKKPVNFGFVDFTTLEQRKFFCDEELRLNRRLAENLYIKIIGIYGSHSHPQLLPEGKAIEYAVQMREFPQQWLMSHLASQKLLEAEHIDSMANVIADFHNNTERASVNSGFGNWDSIVNWTHENFHHIEEVIPKTQLPADYLQIKTWCKHQEELLKPEIQLRRQNGCIRECHGDLHLGNMVLLDKQCTPFDCIEFNDELRWIDTMSEIAFVVMDLQARDHRAFAWRFLNRYLLLTGDYSGLSMLAYYVVYRALVRAKVEALSVDKQNVNQSLHYLDIARCWIMPKSPVLICMHGLSGSGKSTVAENLAYRSGAIHIRSDIERKRLFDLGATADSGSTTGQGIYTENASQRTYDKLAELAENLLSNGFNVIVDAANLKNEQRQVFRLLAKKSDIPFFLLSCQASERELQNRITKRLKRGNEASEADHAVLANQIKTQEILSTEEQEDPGTIICEQPQLSEAQLTFILAHGPSHRTHPVTNSRRH